MRETMAQTGTPPLARPYASMHLPSLAVGLTIMVAGTLYPPLMADAAGKADHALTMALLWAMSSGFVRGVGFVPQLRLWRLVLSGWACAAAMLLAGWFKLLQ